MTLVNRLTLEVVESLLLANNSDIERAIFALKEVGFEHNLEFSCSGWHGRQVYTHHECGIVVKYNVFIVGAQPANAVKTLFVEIQGMNSGFSHGLYQTMLGRTKNALCYPRRIEFISMGKTPI